MQFTSCSLKARIELYFGICYFATVSVLALLPGRDEPQLPESEDHPAQEGTVVLQSQSSSSLHHAWPVFPKLQSFVIFFHIRICFYILNILSVHFAFKLSLWVGPA